MWAEVAAAEQAEVADLRFVPHLGNVAPMVVHAAAQRDLLGGADQVSTDAPSEAERSSENSSAGADAAAGPETPVNRVNDLQDVSTGSTAEILLFA